MEQASKVLTLRDDLAELADACERDGGDNAENTNSRVSTALVDYAKRLSKVAREIGGTASVYAHDRRATAARQEKGTALRDITNSNGPARSTIAAETPPKCRTRSEVRSSTKKRTMPQNDNNSNSHKKKARVTETTPTTPLNRRALKRTCASQSPILPKKVAPFPTTPDGVVATPRQVLDVLVALPKKDVGVTYDDWHAEGLLKVGKSTFYRLLSRHRRGLAPPKVWRYGRGADPPFLAVSVICKARRAS